MAVFLTDECEPFNIIDFRKEFIIHNCWTGRVILEIMPGIIAMEYKISHNEIKKEHNFLYLITFSKIIHTAELFLLNRNIAPVSFTGRITCFT